MHGRLQGVGLGWRRELAADLIADPGSVDFVEVIAESCARPVARREAIALRHTWPVVPHGVKLSLGSATGIDRARANDLGALARRLEAPFVSEHIAFTATSSREIGHLIPLPRTRRAVAVLARNVQFARRALPDVPLLLENVAATLRWPDDEMDEPTFYQEVIAATGCDLLLDLGNLWANAVNEGRDPLRSLLAFPLDRVAMVHLAGGRFENGFYFDTHADPVPAPVLDLLRALVARGVVPGVLIERDGNFGAFADLRAELEAVRAILRNAPERCEATSARTVPAPPQPEAACDRLRLDQEALAAALTTTTHDEAVERAFGAAALQRTRAILLRKRVDEALVRLPRTKAHGASAHALAVELLATTPRPPRSAALVDALSIANALAHDPRFGEAARLDARLLRTWFHGPDSRGTIRRRWWPDLTTLARRILPRP